jgi:phosphoribosyl 1,2-cyclic phosphodiesterase
MSTADQAALRVTCWGTRGSIPSPGPETLRYGGNTSCVEVRAGGRRYVFDAGSGIRALGRRMDAEGGAWEADLFVTHYHWDHIQGFPYWRPLYHGTGHVRVHGPRAGIHGPAEAFAGQMSSEYFPVALDVLPAQMDFLDMDEAEPWTDDVAEVRALAVRHGCVTHAYRLRAGGTTIAYAPDNELGGADAEWYGRLVEFARGADLLLHDSMYTDAEYERAHGWGHSTHAQAVRLAEDAAVRRLHFFHHAPDRADADLDRILAHCREDLAARGSPLEIAIATEGEEIAIGFARDGGAVLAEA